MKKIKRKPNELEKYVIKITQMLNIADLYLKERGLVEDFKIWSLEKQKSVSDAT